MNLKKRLRPASLKFAPRTWTAFNCGKAATLIFGLFLPLGYTPAAEFDGEAELRKSRIAQKIRAADVWQTCRRVGIALRAKSDPKKAEEQEVLFKVTMEPPYSITNAHLVAIRSRTPEIGMSMCGVIAALGFPVRNNRSVSTRGERFQMVYERPRIYVYLQGNHAGDARVTSWQD